MRELTITFDEADIDLLSPQAQQSGMSLDEFVASRLRKKIAQRHRQPLARKATKALPKNVILFRKKRVPKKVGRQHEF